MVCSRVKDLVDWRIEFRSGRISQKIGKVTSLLSRFRCKALSLFLSPSFPIRMRQKYFIGNRKTLCQGKKVAEMRGDPFSRGFGYNGIAARGLISFYFLLPLLRYSLWDYVRSGGHCNALRHCGDATDR